MRVNIPDPKFKRIVIVGGGFAGLNLAKKLANSEYQVVLIDKNNFHQFQPLFYQVAMAGLEPSSISFPLRKLFQKCDNVSIRVLEVERVDPKAKIIYTPIGHLKYDYLVLAMGADTNFFGNEEIARNCIPMKSVSEALYLRNTILTDLEKALSETDYETRQGYIDIAIVGGGPTGVEIAGSLAEMKKHIIPKDYPELDAMEIDIYLLQGSDCLLKGMSKEASDNALKYLTNLGVNVKLNARVTNVDGKFVYTKDGETFQANKVIWAAGIQANKIEGLPESSFSWGNRLKVNRFNQLLNDESIFAIGDLAYMETENYPEGHPQMAQPAIQQGRHLSKNFKNLTKGKAFTPFTYKDLGSMATIGRHLAVADLPRWKFKGTFAWLIWLFVHLFQLIGTRNKLIVFINWLWNYGTYDQSLRLIIKPWQRNQKKQKEKVL